MATTMAKILYGHFHMVHYHIIIFLAIFRESPQNSYGQTIIWYSSRSSMYWILEISHWTWWIFPLFINQIISILWYIYIDVNTYTESKAHTIFHYFSFYSFVLRLSSGCSKIVGPNTSWWFPHTPDDECLVPFVFSKAARETSKMAGKSPKQIYI